MSFLQKNKIPIAIIISGLFIAIAIFFGLRGEKDFKVGKNTNKQPIISQTQSLSPTKILKQKLTSTTASVPTEKIVLSSTVAVPQLKEEQIRQGLMVKTIIPADKLQFEIGEQRDRENRILIRGTVKNKDEEHGAGFFAYCDLEKCEVTFVGQEVPKCSEVNPYGYPLDWADYCVDNRGEIVKR